MRTIALLAVTVLASACQAPSGPPIEIRDVELTPPRGGMGMSAGYLVVSNNSNADVSITRVDSPQYGSVEIHESTLVDGVARMRPIKALDVPAGTTVTLERGGKHLMLMRPVETPDAVTLNFYAGDALLVTIEAHVAESG